MRVACVRGSLWRMLAMENKEFVTYLDFGAVGDGVTDDFEAIYRAHEYANENGLPVILDGERTYYIHETRINGEVKSAIIKTDVNWGTSKFIIDDTDITGLDGTGRNARHIFTVSSDYEQITITDEEVLAKIGSIGEGTKKINLELGYPALIVIYNDNERVFKRYGESYRKLGIHNGAIKNEILLIDGEGNIDESTPFMFDYAGLTKIEVIRADVKPITVQGGEFTTLASRVDARNPETGLMAPYISRGLSINRSNTTVLAVKHYMKNEVTTYEHRDFNMRGAHYAGFYRVSCANDVVIKNCVLTGRRYYRISGTYEFMACRVNKIKLIGCMQSNFFVTAEDGEQVCSMSRSPVSDTLRYWGAGESDFCKNMEYVNSVISRFDAHQGLYNGKIINCKMNFMELTGKGELYIENLEWYSYSSGALNCMAYLRGDYGSTWNGTITFKNCTAHFEKGDAYVFCHGYVNWDYANESHFPNLIIDNFKIKSLEPGAKLYLKTPTKEPAMHKEQTLIVARTNPDGTIDEGNMNNANRVVPPEFIRVINCDDSVKVYVENIPFFENTKLEGVIVE